MQPYRRSKRGSPEDVNKMLQSLQQFLCLARDAEQVYKQVFKQFAAEFDVSPSEAEQSRAYHNHKERGVSLCHNEPFELLCDEWCCKGRELTNEELELLGNF